MSLTIYSVDELLIDIGFVKALVFSRKHQWLSLVTSLCRDLISDLNAKCVAYTARLYRSGKVYAECFIKPNRVVIFTGKMAPQPDCFSTINLRKRGNKGQFSFFHVFKIIGEVDNLCCIGLIEVSRSLV